MQERLEIIRNLNNKMVSNFKSITNLYPVLYDKTLTIKEKKKECNLFREYVFTIYEILLEYMISIYNMENAIFEEEWLKKHISDDNSHILAEELSGDKNPISIEVYERESYIQEEYIQTLLKLQYLVLNDAKFYDLFKFYDSDIYNIVGCAKMLMYHLEDLEDLVVCLNC